MQIKVDITNADWSFWGKQCEELTEMEKDALKKLGSYMCSIDSVEGKEIIPIISLRKENDSLLIYIDDERIIS